MREFLKNYKSSKGQQFTHTSMSGGSWNIPQTELSTFYKLYSKDVTETELHLTEKHMPAYGPIVIDFDFKFKEKINPRPINKRIRDDISDFLTNILQEIFGSDNDYTCIVLQRPSRYKKKELWTDGLHIQYPYIVCDYIIQHALRNKFMSDYELEVECEEPINKIYDEAVIERNNWCLYLSTKPDKKPYDVKEIHNSDIEWDDLSQLQKVKLLSIRNKKELIKPVNHDCIDTYTKKITKIEKKIIIKMDIRADQEYDEKKIRSLLNMLDQSRKDEYYEWIKIGMILHNCSVTDKNNKIDYLGIWDEWSKGSNKYENGVCKRQWKYFRGSSLSIASLVYYAKTDNPNLFMNKKINEYMKIQLKKDYKIKNIIRKNQRIIVELKNNYCIFVKNCHENDTMYVLITKDGWCLKCSECTYEQYPEANLNSISNDRLNMFGIKIEKKEDDTYSFYDREYNVFDDVELNKLMYMSLNGTGYKISELVYYLYKGKFNCTVDKVWYEYTNHKWEFGERSIFNLLSSDVTKYYSKMVKFYEKIKPINDKEAEHLNHMKEVITGLIRKLETTQFKNNIMTDICTTFYLNNKKFESKLDANPYLIGFDNGIYDLDKHIFREGCSEDYITMSVNYDYEEEYSEHNENLMKFLEDIQPIEDDRDFLLKYTATGLSGINSEEVSVFLSGKTRNGKTKYKDLVAYTLGDYFVTFASNLLTLPRPSPSKPQPELMAFRNKRFALGSEPEAVNGKINTSFFKFFTGNETIPCRTLFDRKIMEFLPTHKIGVLCNNIPSMDDPNDEAVWERTICIEFPIKFVDNPSNENEKPINRNLKASLPHWKQDFMLLLIEKYKQYAKDGLKATDRILKFTKSYKEENDIFKQFLDECTEVSDKHIHTSTLYGGFKSWYVKNNPKTKIPSNKVFVAGLRNHVVIENVKINNKPTTGTKYLKLINNNDIDFD